ncbi:MAG TPA: hypothetical protein VNP04_31695 [Alphaproteobacteria bacterium]|nr:hypothetical protein [Alphaproteobacteria bacterium]
MYVRTREGPVQTVGADAWLPGATGSRLGQPVGLEAAILNAAIRANRLLARRIGWGCVVGGQVRPIPELLTLLGLAASATEEDIAQAIARYQQALGQRGDGHLGPRTWAQMLRPGRPGQPVVPPLNFKPASFPVFFGGRRLGVLEKTAPYEKCFFDGPAGSACRGTRNNTAGERGGCRIQLGFRVTDIEAVRAARFVDATGEPRFNWLQVINTNRPLVEGPPIHVIRRFRQYVDPAAIPRDAHPYYWDEPDEITGFVNRQAIDARFPNASRLCYDLIFFDIPSRLLSHAQPGLGVFWNAEVALVGIRAGNRNVVLNTVTWGFDIRPEPGGLTVRLNALQAGRFGGSTAFRQVIARELRAGHFPGHCIVGLPGAAGCR